MECKYTNAFFRTLSAGWYQNVASLVCVTMAVNSLIYPLTALAKNQAKAGRTFVQPMIHTHPPRFKM